MSLRDLLVKVRGLLAAIAPLTPVKIDDAAIGVIDAILADATLFGWFEAKAKQADAGVLSLETEPPVALQAALEQRQIPWARLLEMLPLLLELLRAFKG